MRVKASRDATLAFPLFMSTITDAVKPTCDVTIGAVGRLSAAARLKAPFDAGGGFKAERGFEACFEAETRRKQARV